MAAENFNTFSETDPNSLITRTSSRVSWEDLTRNEDAFVFLDKGVAFFAGSFVHRLTFSITAGDASSSLFSALWLVANAADSYDTVRAGDALALLFFFSGATPNIRLVESDGGSQAESAQFNITLGVTYHLTITRDEDTGANGTLTCAIYSDAARTNLLDTLTRTLGVKNDFRYVYPLSSFNATNANKHTGFTQDLDITNSTGTPQVSTQLPTAITATTATGNGTIADLGISAVTAHGWVWDTSAIDTAVVPGSQPNSTDEGAGALGPFTTAITGLTGGLIYFGRAYATNTQGTTYGEGVQWKAGASYSTKEWGDTSMKGNELHTVGEDGVERAHMGTPV
ncbi:hypothetical protein LCGC14_2002710 [marine sediment metagenome]|uniref:Uncharacterized protein n=1 Tax=marine sediment metagenome TaxID=412755 RepID=A0A0F9F2V5_9ZZZZ